MAYSAEAVQQYCVEMALFAWALSGEGRRQSDNISTMWIGGGVNSRPQIKEGMSNV